MPKLKESECVTSEVIESWKGLTVGDVLRTRFDYKQSRVADYVAQNGLSESDLATSWPAISHLLWLVKQKRRY